MGDPNADASQRQRETAGVDDLEVTMYVVYDADGTTHSTDSSGNNIYYYVIPTENHIDLNTGGAAPGYQGDYVTAALGEGQTDLGAADAGYSEWEYGSGNPVPVSGYNAEDALDSGVPLQNTEGRLVDAEGNLRTFSEVYVIPEGTSNVDGTGRYVDPNTGGGSPGTLDGGGVTTDSYVTSGPTNDSRVHDGIIQGVLPGTYSSDAGQNPDGSSRGYAVDGDSLAGMTYSIAYVCLLYTSPSPRD